MRLHHVESVGESYPNTQYRGIVELMDIRMRVYPETCMPGFGSMQYGIEQENQTLM